MASYGAELGKRVQQDVAEAPDRLHRLHHIEASYIFGAIARNDGVYKQLNCTLKRVREKKKTEPKCDANSTRSWSSARIWNR